jgi:hypothetical protein
VVDDSLYVDLECAVIDVDELILQLDTLRCVVVLAVAGRVFDVLLQLSLHAVNTDHVELLHGVALVFVL